MTGINLNGDLNYTHQDFVAYDVSNRNVDIANLSNLSTIYDDNQTLARINLRNGNRILLVETGSRIVRIRKQIILASDCRELGKVWDYSDSNWTPMRAVANGHFYNTVKFHNSLEFNVEETTYDDIRKKIYQFLHAAGNAFKFLNIQCVNHMNICCCHGIVLQKKNHYHFL